MKILLIKADRMIAEQKSPVILGFFGVDGIFVFANIDKNI